MTTRKQIRDATTAVIAAAAPTLNVRRGMVEHLTPDDVPVVSVFMQSGDAENPSGFGRVIRENSQMRVVITVDGNGSDDEVDDYAETIIAAIFASSEISVIVDALDYVGFEYARDPSIPFLTLSVNFVVMYTKG